MTQPVLSTELSNREFFIRRWEQEYPAFVDVCKSLPSERLDHRPHSGSRSAGELVALLVAMEQSCLEVCKSGKGSYNAGMRWHPESVQSTLDAMLAAYESHHHQLAVQLNEMEDATWNRPAWLIVGEQEIVLRDTVGGLLWIALFDAVHHRGQLSTYIRPMGGKVPSIYGPSADSQARESGRADA
jgi:uncharacterized damage-inducible protein DinB